MLGNIIKMVEVILSNRLKSQTSKMTKHCNGWLLLPDLK